MMFPRLASTIRRNVATARKYRLRRQTCAIRSPLCVFSMVLPTRSNVELLTSVLPMALWTGLARLLGPMPVLRRPSSSVPGCISSYSNYASQPCSAKSTNWKTSVWLWLGMTTYEDGRRSSIYRSSKGKRVT